MNQIRTKDSALHCYSESQERTQRKVLRELIITQLTAVLTLHYFQVAANRAIPLLQRGPHSWPSCDQTTSDKGHWTQI